MSSNVHFHGLIGPINPFIREFILHTHTVLLTNRLINVVLQFIYFSLPQILRISHRRNYLLMKIALLFNKIFEILIISLQTFQFIFALTDSVGDPVCQFIYALVESVHFVDHVDEFVGDAFYLFVESAEFC